MHAKDIQQLIENGLANSTAIVEGEDGVHFTVIVVASAFVGKNRVQKQQMVYATLGNRIHDGTIHALSIKAFTPEEWQHTNTKES